MRRVVFLTYVFSTITKYSHRFPGGVSFPRVCRMYSSLLSVLLMGMVPLVGDVAVGSPGLQYLHVSAPAPLASEVTTALADLHRHVSASGMLILDLQSGQEVFSRDAAVRRPIASLTKLMTALIIVEHHSLKEHLTIPRGIPAEKGHVVHLVPGEEFTVGDVLTALLVASDNDAAETLARYHSGTSEAFVREMNDRAISLGLTDTTYANPVGFDDPAQLSTPRDVALLASYVLHNPEIRTRMSMADASIVSAQGHTVTFSNTNELLHQDAQVIAGKTGTTDAAGQCLLSVVKEGRHEYVVVILGSRERYADMRVVLHALAALFT